MADAQQDPRRLTRRAAIGGAVGAAVVAGVGVPLLLGGGKKPAARAFLRLRSLPELEPPAVKVLLSLGATAPGHLFVAPKKGEGQAGAMILDPDGGLVWFRPSPPGTSAFDFRAQRYGGRPVLTWWEGHSDHGHGVRGHGVILDDSYRLVAIVQGGNGLVSDLHEFQLTPRDTALVTAFQPVARDLSAVGGPADGQALDSIVQEIDVASGRVLFEWRSLDHVPLTESFRPPPNDAGEAYDYFHINSVGLEPDGNLLVSARHTSCVYKVDRHSGSVIWRLGGKSGDFRLGPGARFAFQHDARRHSDGTLSLFDNAAPQLTGHASRAIVLGVDEQARTARLLHAYRHVPPVEAESQGSAQVLENGNMFVGWGSGQPDFSEFTRDGRMIFDARFKGARTESYRAYRMPWLGRPAEPPALVAAAVAGGARLHASWNGSTELARWQVLAGARPGSLAHVKTVPRRGLETAIELSGPQRHVAVRALDARGRPLATSPTVAVQR